MVRMMMAAPGAAAAGAAPAPTAALTLDQKKKLLWGSKKAEAAVSVAAPAQAASALQRGPAEAVYGANRWDVAEFSSEAEKWVHWHCASPGPACHHQHTLVCSRLWDNTHYVCVLAWSSLMAAVTSHIELHASHCLGIKVYVGSNHISPV